MRVEAGRVGRERREPAERELLREDISVELHSSRGEYDGEIPADVVDVLLGGHELVESCYAVTREEPVIGRCVEARAAGEVSESVEDAEKVADEVAEETSAQPARALGRCSTHGPR